MTVNRRLAKSHGYYLQVSSGAKGHVPCYRLGSEWAASMPAYPAATYLRLVLLLAGHPASR
jgi:hypothetical protein